MQVHEVILSSVNGIELSSSLISSIDINRATSLANKIKLSSVNEVTIIVKPIPSSQSSNYICDQVSLLLSIGVGFLLFTNLITIIVFIISCLWFIKSKRRHKKL